MPAKVVPVPFVTAAVTWIKTEPDPNLPVARCITDEDPVRVFNLKAKRYRGQGGSTPQYLQQRVLLQAVGRHVKGAYAKRWCFGGERMRPL